MSLLMPPDTTCPDIQRAITFIAFYILRASASILYILLHYSMDAVLTVSVGTEFLLYISLTSEVIKCFQTHRYL